MFRPRVIPVLLLKDKGLVKTIKFSKPTYIGDPINAVKLFNEMEADELVFLDITATNENRTPSFELIKQIGDEAFMPFAVGGGIKTISDIKNIIAAGAEKVVINSAAFFNKNLIEDAANVIGSQSIIVAIDVKKNFFGKYEVYVNGGKKNTLISPEKYADEIAKKGAGEIMVNSIDRDGKMLGYDLNLIKTVSSIVDIPVVAFGGAGKKEDFVDAISCGASAVAAGSMFVYYGSRKGVLINYPEKLELETIFNR